MSQHERHILEQDPYRAEHVHFVDQIVAGGMITDFVIRDAFLRVDRIDFMPEHHRDLAYHNIAVSLLKSGEIAIATISEPVLVAQMIQALHLSPEDVVLEIGTGTGYSSAVMSHLVRAVYTIERIPELAQQAQERLRDLGYDSIHVLQGDGVLGYPEAGQYDAIVSTVALKSIPQAFIDQLAVGGRIVMPVGEDINNLDLIYGEKMLDGMHFMTIGRVRFVPVITEDPDAGWCEEEATALLTINQASTTVTSTLESLATKRNMSPEQYSIHLAALMGFTEQTPQSVIASTLDWMQILNVEEDDE